MPASCRQPLIALALTAGLLLAGCGSVGGPATPAAAPPADDVTAADSGGGFDASGGGSDPTATAADLPDPCSLLTEAQIGAALEASEPMYKATATTTTNEAATPSGQGRSCRILWSVQGSAGGAFSIEVQPVEDWDFVLIGDDTPTPIGGVASADQAVMVLDQAWARMSQGYAIGILGSNTESFATGLLRAAAQNAP